MTPHGRVRPMHHQRLYVSTAQQQPQHGGLGRAGLAVGVAVAAAVLFVTLWPQPRLPVSDTQVAVLAFNPKHLEVESRVQYTIVPLTGQSLLSKTDTAANVESNEPKRPGPTEHNGEELSSRLAGMSYADGLLMPEATKSYSSPVQASPVKADNIVTPYPRYSGDDHLDAEPISAELSANQAEGLPQSEPLVIVVLACFFLMTCAAAAPHCSAADDAASGKEEVPASTKGEAPASSREAVEIVDESAMPPSTPTGFKEKHRLPLLPISIQEQVPSDATAMKADGCETPKICANDKFFPHALTASPFKMDAPNFVAAGDGKLPRSRRCRTATPEPAEGYKVRKMYLASVGKKGIVANEEPPQPYPFKSPRLREEAEREVVRMVAAAAEAEEAAMERRLARRRL